LENRFEVSASAELLNRGFIMLMMSSDSSLGSYQPDSLSASGIISEKSFRKLSDIVYQESGISLGEQKRVMLSTRIAKRLRATHCSSYEEYIDYVSQPENKDEELVFMLNAVTTNKTDFFREKHHFEYMTDILLPKLERENAFSATAPLRVWSAGCSSGEEPYTIAFVLSEYFKGDTSKYRILATDLSTKVLNKAMKGIYPEHTVEDVPKYLKMKYMQRGGGDWSKYWRVIPEIRRTVTFGKLNFIDSDYMIREKFNVVFHRNVMIYFDKDTRTKIVDKLCQQLVDRGHLFIGHSETLHQISDKFTLEAQTIYRKNAN
jgi:chemotaxis protein methyltransferase CheR